LKICFVQIRDNNIQPDDTGGSLMTTRVLLDTDIGSDIDDAVCLAYLLSQPACELMGITTVTGETTKRAMMVSALCKVAGQEIPIYPGLEQPISVPQLQKVAQQASALAKWEHDIEFPQGEAIEFLRHTIRSYPGEIVLLTIGPKTNLGTLFNTDPEIPSLLKSLVMMCGVFAEGKTEFYPLEWNAFGDPHATAIVYQARVKSHRSIGLDVTERVRMKADQVRSLFKAKILQPVLDFAEVWFKERDEIKFHDPVAAATIFDDRICQFERGTVAVELTKEKELGATDLALGGTDAPHEVALQIDPARFFDHFFSVFES
jgi:inosine-uridine nucleoside N-ribohydrolase